MEEKDNNINKIVKYWPIILLLGAFIFAWGQTLMKNTYQDKELDILSGQQIIVGKDISDIKTSIARIEGLLNKFNGIAPQK